MGFLEEATFKQVELRLLFNKLKRRHIRVPYSQYPETAFENGHSLNIKNNG
ncbi:MAG: hypothetical protein ACI8WB_004879, partial [Phenylobacterium sp.]